MNERNVILGSNHQSTRIKNRALVLKIICTGEDISRIDLSRQTGLSKMSITNIVHTLIDDNFVVEQEDKELPEKNASVGRKPVLLSANTSVYAIVGLYISRDYAVATLSNLKCEILLEEKCDFSIEESEASFTEKIISLSKEVLHHEAATNRKILGIGVSCIGPLDKKKGVILEPPNFHQLKFIPIRSILEAEFGYPVYIDNDMNAAALAERLYGKGKNIRNFVYVGVTNGIGAGIITNDELYAGNIGLSGEIGHTTINYEGPKCACGNTGCLELYAGIPQVVAQAISSLVLEMDSALIGVNDLKWKDIVQYAGLGDAFAVNLIDRLCRYFSVGLVSITNAFDPAVIYIGHDIALAGSLLTEKLEFYTKGKAISSKYNSVPIEISAFGEKSPIIGSAAVVLDKLFHGLYEVNEAIR